MAAPTQTPVPAVPSSGIVTSMDVIAHQAQNAEQMVAGLITVFMPSLAPWLPRILVIFNGFVGLLDQIAGTQASSRPGMVDLPGGGPPITPVTP